MMPGLGIEPGTHWWKVSSLTTAPTLLPKVQGFLFLAVRGARQLARNGRQDFTFGYGKNYKVMLTMVFWLFICLLKFLCISSVIA